MLNSLKKEWKIDSVEKVVQRALIKYSWRINEKNWGYNWSWHEIKQKQKEKLLEEIKEDKGCQKMKESKELKRT